MRELHIGTKAKCQNLIVVSPIFVCIAQNSRYVIVAADISRSIVCTLCAERFIVTRQRNISEQAFHCNEATCY